MLTEIAMQGPSVASTAPSTPPVAVAAVCQPWLAPSPSILIPCQPGWASILLVIAGGFAAVELLFGFSRSWIRYVNADVRLQGVLGELDLGWAKRYASLGDRPSVPQQGEMVELAISCLQKAQAIVEQETTGWTTEMQAALQKLDETLAATRRDAQEAITKSRDAIRAGEEEARKEVAGARPGSISLEVTNGDQCADGWTVYVDREALGESFTGRTAAILSVTPGHHRIRVKENFDGAASTRRAGVAETTVVVRADQVAEPRLTLA